MPAQHGELNELAAEKAVEVVQVTNGGQDPEAIANGGRVVSEAIYRTLAKLGIDLPEGFSDALVGEFDAARTEERITSTRHRDLVREMEASGP